MDITKFVRKNILELKPYTSARSTNLSGILLDANENAFGSIIGDLNLELNRYPDPNQNALRKKLANFLGISWENLFFGVGSDEIIDLLLKIFCIPNKDNVIICEPTYGMYSVACNINDVRVKQVLLNKNFDIDFEQVVVAKDENTKMIFLCSPNNPTGNLLNYNIIEKLAKLEDLLIVIDEAYIDFSSKTDSLNLLNNFNNVIILRTFSKAWGLAGVRCGYAAANKQIIDLLFKVKAPYSINKLTENIILKALDKTNNYIKIVELIKNEREYLFNELSKLDKVIKVYNSESNFILFKVENPKEIYKKLAQKNIIIRDRSNQVNLDGCLRVSVGTVEQNKLFINTLKELL